MRQKEDKIQSTRDWIVAKAILDRDFDIPDDLYSEVTEGVILRIIDKPVPDKSFFHNEFTTNEHFRRFAEYVRWGIRRKNDAIYNRLTGVKFVYQRELLQLIFFGQTDWVTYIYAMQKAYDYKNSVVAPIDSYVITQILQLLEFVLCEKEFEFQVINIYNVLRLYVSNEDIIERLKKDADNKDKRITIDNVVSFVYMINCNKSYADTLFCLNNGIPVLYEEYDIPLLHMYIETVLSSGYRGELDDGLLHIKSVVTEEEPGQNTYVSVLAGNLWEIGNTLNQNNMIYYCILTGTVFTTDKMMDIMNGENSPYHDYGWSMNASGYIKDFKHIILMHGHNRAGISNELQVLFLQHGGDISTMFGENGKLLNEASIIKMADQLPRLIQLLSTESLYFLLTNSPEFVKNIMVSSSLSMSNYIAIARALFTVPVDEDLWKAINAYRSTGWIEIEEAPLLTDYRVFVILHIVSEISTDVLFNNVPEAMIYIEPSVLYITRNMSDDTMKYAPVHRLVPYLKAYLERNSYKRLNLYCDGHHVPITSAIGGDADFMINLMVKGERYGYICDMNCEDLTKVIDSLTIMETLGDLSYSDIKNL